VKNCRKQDLHNISTANRCDGVWALDYSRTGGRTRVGHNGAECGRDGRRLWILLLSMVHYSSVDRVYTRLTPKLGHYPRSPDELPGKFHQKCFPVSLLHGSHSWKRQCSFKDKPHDDNDDDYYYPILLRLSVCHTTV